MIDTATEDLISFDEVAAERPSRRGKKTHISTIIREATKGRVTPDGGRVYLEAFRAGRMWFTSRQAVQRFYERTTPRPGRPGESLAQAKAESDRHAAAERVLESAGI